MIVAMLLSRAGLADAPADYRIRLHGGSVGAVGGPAGITGAPSVGGGVLGGITFHRDRVAFDAAARELYATEDSRILGALFFGARFTPAGAAHLRLGFAHNHETPLDVFAANPIGATFGSAEGIRHRSGVELGAGSSLPIGTMFGDRMALEVDLGLSWLPGDQGPPLYALLSLGGSIGVGKPQ